MASVYSADSDPNVYPRAHAQLSKISNAIGAGELAVLSKRLVIVSKGTAITDP